MENKKNKAIKGDEVGMRKFLMETYDIERNSVAVVEAETLQDAFVEFIDYYGIRYPFKKRDIVNLVKDWSLVDFIEYFENSLHSNPLN